jgi:hypothetical protein
LLGQWARVLKRLRACGRERARDGGGLGAKLLRWLWRLRWRDGRRHRAAAEARRCWAASSGLTGVEAWHGRGWERAAAVVRRLGEEGAVAATWRHSVARDFVEYGRRRMKRET